MKRILIVLVVIILALLILGAVLWKAFGSVGSPAKTVTLPQGGPAVTIPSTISNTEQSPSKFAVGFYQLYITGSPETYPEHITDWLTPAFSSSLDSIGQNIDADPILLSQDFPPQWAQNISATTLSQTSTDAWIQLTFSPALDPTTGVLHRIKVHLLYNQGQWRIDNVVSGD